MQKLENRSVVTPPAGRQKEVTLRRESSKNQRTLLGFFKKKSDVSSSPAPQSSPTNDEIKKDVIKKDGRLWSFSESQKVHLLKVSQ